MSRLTGNNPSARVAVALTAVFAMLGTAQVTAQKASTTLIPRPQAQLGKLNRIEHRIRLNVSVTDASGKPVAGLTPADFTIFDNGAPRTISAFRAIDQQAPAVRTHVTLVIDGVNNNSGIARVRMELEMFLSSKRGPLPFPTELAVFSDAGLAQSDPSTERGALTGDLARMTRNVRGMVCNPPTGADLLGAMGESGSGGGGRGRLDCKTQRFVFSLNILQKLAEERANLKGRQILIWLGPGWTVPTDREAGQILPGQVRDNFAAPIAAVLTELRKASITLNAVSWSNFARTGSPHNAQESPAGKPASIFDLASPALVRDSGGLAIDKVKDLSDALDSYLADGKQDYVLSFDPARRATAGEYRSIEVRVDRPDVKVRTMTGYYVEP